MRSFLALVRRFHADERGVFAVLFGILAIVLIAAAGAVVDYTSMEQTRTRAQIALDSAVLGLAPTIYDDPTEEELIASAFALVEERLDDPNVTIDITDAEVDKPEGTLRLTGTVTVPMAFMQLIGFPSLTATVRSEAKKASINIEVSVALDNSGSMKNYIDELQDGLDGLIELVVSDVQTPTYSKMAIVPWSSIVYAGDYADALRGSVPAGKAATADWAENVVEITGATKANPVVITTSGNHGYTTGDIVYINNVRGMTQLNNTYYSVEYNNSTSFKLRSLSGTYINGSSYSTYQTRNGDKVRKCIQSSCDAVVTAEDHGFVTGDYVRPDTNVGDYNNAFEITKLNDDQLVLIGSSDNSPPLTTPTAASGNLYCTTFGCEWYRFQRQGRSDYYTWRITKCVTERPTETYSDVPPSETLLGPNYYSSSAGNCDSGFNQTITPLTADKDVLLAESAKMDDYNTTAGHLGTAWAWYLLAPDWGYLWPNAENVPSEYGADNTLKVAILMTDGVYNVEYCKGVVESTINNCNAPDDSTDQARALCTAMKAAGIVIYTVGFNISSNSSPAVTMRNCATDLSKYFQPATGEELVEDFAEIGQDITELRLSQ
jgi:Flp pilus assembly protein TadG